MTSLPPGVPARRAALKLLDAVLRRGEPLELALHGATQGIAERADRALAHVIAAEVLRRAPDLDALIDSVTQQRLADDVKARQVLRIALVQALKLGTPPHAAIATALPLVDGGPRKLVHGVFGTLMRAGARLPERPRLLPQVAERWGEDMAAHASLALAARPPVDLSLKDPTATAEWSARLEATSLAPGHVRLAQARDGVPAIEGFAGGDWWVQDLAASIPARLLGTAPAGGTVYDLCAAPGGKTMQLAAAGWAVTALDQSARRLERLKDNLRRTDLAANIVQADVMTWQPHEPADAVLLDAPCTATGIFRRHPDVLHRIGPNQIVEMAALQARLLGRAAAWVKPGGRLVYAVCSLEAEEGEAQIAPFLAENPQFAIETATGLPPGIAAAKEGWVRTRPGMLEQQGGLDGFFIVAFRRDGR